MYKFLIKNNLILIFQKLIKILLLLNQYFLIALLLRCSIFKNKKIFSNNKNKKNILVLTKTSGLQDLIYAYKNQKKK